MNAAQGLAEQYVGFGVASSSTIEAYCAATWPGSHGAMARTSTCILQHWKAFLSATAVWMARSMQSRQ
jgi:hypothetical protein